ncbi:MAG: hypothetical protein M5U15_13735 [Kiritimatiellae bacterium]|nr:hypothetical protein [Kiritimatiellia bacterium]
MAEQLGASDIIGTLGLGTPLAKFETQEFTKTSGTKYAQRKSRVGDVIEEAVTETVEEYELSVLVKDHSKPAVTIDLGGAGYGSGANALVVTRVSVRQVSNNYPTLSLTCHRHPVLESGATHDARKYAVTLPALCWGINEVISITGATPPEEITSATFEASVDHVDKYNREGTKFLIGASTNCQLVETLEVLKSSDPDLQTNWFADPAATKEITADFATKTLKHHRHLPPAA